MSLKHRPYYQKHHRWEMLAELSGKSVGSLKIHFWRRKLSVMQKEDVKKYIISVLIHRI